MINLYYHGGSANHGCEAIVRSTEKILNDSIRLFSSAINEDIKYGLSEVVELKADEEKRPKRNSISSLLCTVYYKLFKSDYYYLKTAHKSFVRDIKIGDIYLSIGGDNYCYSGVDRLAYYNKFIKSNGAKTVLWGCSIEPGIIDDKVAKDLKNYDLITVRESLSYEGLQKAGIIENVILCADPAFQLEKKPVDLPSGVNRNNAVGINVSPLVMEKGDRVFDNFVKLVEHIISNTDYQLLLIPHVVKQDSDDRIPLHRLFSCFEKSNRVYMIDDMDCQKLKGVISQCRFFIGARTHATIAAYSTCVPTLVVGYSIKSKGIAKDIFDTYENYVIQADYLNTDEDLLKSFFWLEQHEERIKEHLEGKMPEYRKKAIVKLDSALL